MRLDARLSGVCQHDPDNQESLWRHGSMMVPEVVTRRRLTLADYEALPDDQDYEIIDGALYMSPRARPGHQMVANKLSVTLTGHVMDSNLGEVIPDADLIVDDRNTYVSPDIMFFRADRIRNLDRNDYIRLTPDLIVEILSPSSVDYDRRTKRQTYEKLGVPHYWIADPRSHTVAENVLQPGGQYQQRVVGPDGRFQSALFPDLEIDLARIFA
jgi:Uma2 family endonuclease